MQTYSFISVRALLKVCLKSFMKKTCSNSSRALKQGKERERIFHKDKERETEKDDDNKKVETQSERERD